MKVVSAPFDLTAAQKNGMADAVKKFFTDNQYTYADQIDLCRSWFAPKCCSQRMHKVRAYVMKNECCGMHKHAEPVNIPVYVCSCPACFHVVERARPGDYDYCDY